jgi:hypothetical protein
VTLGVEELAHRVVPTVLSFTVNSLADTPDAMKGDGVALDQFQKTSLRAAIEEGNNTPGSTVTIEFSNQLLWGGVYLDSALPTLVSNFTIIGPGASTGMITPMLGGQFRIFTIGADTTCSISGLTISGGKAQDASGGGGINVHSSGSLTLSSCLVFNNHADLSGGLGGGIAAAGTLIVTNCTVQGNSADTAGGGIWSVGPLSISGCTIYENTAKYGGGIYHDNPVGGGSVPSFSIEDSSITYNYATGASAGLGGGIYIKNGKLTMTGGSLEHNTADKEGGGLYVVVASTDLQLSEVSIRYNAADSKGGGFYIEGGFVEFTNCTLSGNSAGVLGPGGAVKDPGDYLQDGGTWSDTVAQDT